MCGERGGTLEREEGGRRSEGSRSRVWSMSCGRRTAGQACGMKQRQAFDRQRRSSGLQPESHGELLMGVLNSIVGVLKGNQ